jgi:hypothetical protein
MSQLHNIDADVVVIGGGLSGVCAAIAAARHGAKTILVQDRPVLGGNASSEVRVHVCGADCSGGRPHARESGLLEEFRLEEAVRNPQRSATMHDLVLWEFATREPNITLYLNTICHGVEINDSPLPIAGQRPAREGGWGGRAVAAALCSRESTEDRFRFGAKVFIDCTGDGRLGAEAGADFAYGREGKDEYGEPHAQGPDRKTMGSSLMWCARDTGVPVKFTPPPWAHVFVTDEDLPHRGHLELAHGHWWVEYGGELDIVKDAEAIRDHLLACMMGVWDHIKNRGEHGAANWVLDWFGFVPGKRESRRLLGDIVLTENDLIMNAQFPDSVCHGGWGIDTHPPGGIHSPEPPCTFIHPTEVYGIPLRALYSRNIANLFMAGRDASCTHMAMASTRVAATGAVMGQAVGTAAAMCAAKGCLPREVASGHIVELQQQLLKDDLFIPGVAAADPANLARGAKVIASSALPGCSPENVTNGVTRQRGEQTNQWTSDPADPQPWIMLEFDGPKPIREVQLIFDTGFARPLTFTHSDPFNARIIRGPQPETVRAYRVEGRVDGQWQTVAEVRDNYQRVRMHEANVEADAVRLTVWATNGEASARVYEVRLG